MPPSSCVPTALLLTVLPALACAPSGGPPRGQAPHVVAFINVTVIPMDAERVLDNQTVLVRRGVITAVGPAALLQVPPEASQIEGAGRFLLPGLIDAHVHLRDTSELISYLAHGVTTVVHLSGPTGNVPDVVQLRGQVNRGEVLGPTIYTTGRIVDGDPPLFPGTSTPVRTPEEATRVVQSQIDAGVDFIKVYNGLPAEALRAAVTAAHKRNRAVIGHIPRRDGRSDALQTAVHAGLDVIAHGEEFFFTYFYGDVEHQLDEGSIPTPDASLMPAAVRLSREAGLRVMPNLSFVAMTRAQLDDLDRVLADPEVRYLHPSVLDLWRQQNPTTRKDLERFDRRERAKYGFVQELTRALSDAGVPLLLGTDASSPGLLPGRSAHVELAELVKAGLAPAQALAAGTRNPGSFIVGHAFSEPFGTIVPGSRADLILVRGNPLDDIANAAAIDGVMVRGAWFTSAALARLRERP